jgi:maltase-glucoamylase
MAVSDEGRAFGLLILNSNAQEYGFLPQSSVAYRTMGGILDLYIMEEATPEKLIQTYTKLIGTPYLPPYVIVLIKLNFVKKKNDTMK